VSVISFEGAEKMLKKLIPLALVAPLLGGCVVAADYSPPVAYGYGGGYYAPAPTYRPYYPRRYGHYRGPRYGYYGPPPRYYRGY
jgi:hypothetical protein